MQMLRMVFLSCAIALVISFGLHRPYRIHGKVTSNNITQSSCLNIKVGEKQNLTLRFDGKEPVGVCFGNNTYWVPLIELSKKIKAGDKITVESYDDSGPVRHVYRFLVDNKESRE